MEDGKKGLQPSEAFAEYNEECLSSGAVANEPAYVAGRTEGLDTFCSYDIAFTYANDGFVSHQLCSSNLADTFTRGYNAGLSELCTIDGGQAFGQRPGRYQGTYAGESESQFIQRYLSGLELAAYKARRDDADASSEITSLK